MTADACLRCRARTEPATHEQLVRALRILVHGQDVEGLATWVLKLNTLCNRCRDLTCTELEVYTLQALALEREGATENELEMVIRARMAQQEES